jgi:hypothetical protein
LSARYLSLLFTPVGTFTAGTITGAPVTMVRDDQANKFATKKVNDGQQLEGKDEMIWNGEKWELIEEEEGPEWRKAR